jgi:NAD(P)-dependent dehydrogenase (short-subunit alcohol dehydrogenase family)
MDLRLKGRTALITGGSKGIGLSVAEHFAAEGCNLVLVARGLDGLQQAAAQLRQQHAVTVQVHAGDLSLPEQRAALLTACPSPDILINNAGGIPAGNLDEVDDARWRAGWDLKVFGYINLTRDYFAMMRARSRGVIINIIGTMGDRLDPAYIAGCAGNASLIAFTKALGSTSADLGVRVLGVNPGPVESDRLVYLAKLRAKKRLGDESRWQEILKNMPLGRPARAEEIAASVVFLASDRSSYTSGVCVTVDGGLVARGPMP